MRLFFLLTALFTMIYSAPVKAVPLITPIQYIDFSDLQLAKTGVVQTILTPYTLLLRRGEIIYLSSIDIPDAHTETPGPYALMVMDILNDALSGQEVKIYQSKNEHGQGNRMGHLIAHIERTSDRLWVQGMLLRLGLARVRTRTYNRDLAQAMFKIENAARTDKDGLWQDKQYRIFDADDKALEALEGFQIIEGKIIGTAMKNNQIYLNFGPSWKSDTTVSITSEDRKIFNKSGVDPMSWNGKTIRARGWLDHYNGPYMQVSHPEAIEIIDPPDADR